MPARLYYVIYTIPWPDAVGIANRIARPETEVPKLTIEINWSFDRAATLTLYYNESNFLSNDLIAETAQCSWSLNQIDFIWSLVDRSKFYNPCYSYTTETEYQSNIIMHLKFNVW